MDEYHLITTEKKYQRYIQRWWILWIIFMGVLSPLVIIILICELFIYPKRTPKLIKKIFRPLGKSKGRFVSLNRIIFINLEALKKESDDATIDETIQVLIHEDLHKGIAETGFGGYDNHWAVNQISTD